MNAPRIMSAMFLRLAFAALPVVLAGTTLAEDRLAALTPLTSRVDPKAFGVGDETRTVLSATSFLPDFLYQTSPSLGRCIANSTYGTFYASIDLPAGAVVDYIGVNSTTNADGALGVALWQRDRFANMELLYGFSLPSHGWDTDFAGPLGILVTDHIDKELVLAVEQGVFPAGDFQFFAWVEVWWHRTVSPAPATASFNDVPTSHPFFQYIEALKASGVTGGCGDGTNYCPDSPLTRGQMAVFLAKALGLHWPN